MNRKNNQILEQKKWSIILVVQRILGFPFFAALTFIAAISMWLKWIWNFGKYGGEAIAYTKKINKRTIQDVFQKVMENGKFIREEFLEKKEIEYQRKQNVWYITPPYKGIEWTIVNENGELVATFQNKEDCIKAVQAINKMKKFTDDEYI